MPDEWESAHDFSYNVRKLSHAIGLHAEIIEHLRDTVKEVLDKEKKTPEDIERCLDALEKMGWESAELQKTSKELNDYLRDRRLKRERGKNDDMPGT